ncbi:MAG: WD40 repeat domain-containing protein, partial [Cyanobacteria bacterium P01_A01_bin.17]
NQMTEPFYGHSGSIYSVTFSPDGQTIVSGSDDQTIQLWRGSWHSWLALCCSRFRFHPIFKNLSDGFAREAYAVCQSFVWDDE